MQINPFLMKKKNGKNRKNGKNGKNRKNRKKTINWAILLPISLGFTFQLHFSFFE